MNKTAGKTLPSAGLDLVPRELSQLAFVERVLAQAERADVPVAERLRYIGIVSSILDEFFEIRIIDLYDAAQAHPDSAAAELYAAVSARAHRVVARQYALFNQELMPLLAGCGVVVLGHAERTPAQRAWVSDYFRREVRPLLAPIGLDPVHPFPQPMNKALNFILQIEGKDAFGRPASAAILKVPRILPRVIALPDRLAAPGQQVFVMLSSVIRSHLAEVFPGRSLAGFSQFRVTRDSELAVDEREVKNLRQAMRLELTQRHFGNPVRLEVLNTCPPPLVDLLQRQFGLADAAVFRVDGPVNLVRMNQLVDQVRAPGLRWPSLAPAWPARLARGGDIFAQLRLGDVLLHHPFESFDPVLDFLRQAAFDPDVAAIRMTLYRTGANSTLVDLLVEAARRGKEVTVVVELKARFDEEANIDLAERLERVGVQVVYGVVGLKTHSKMLLVLRRELRHKRWRVVPYVHLGTGNYHPGTARLYTDFGMLTANTEICRDVDKVFLHLTGLTRVERLKHLWLAPFDLHRKLQQAIAAEARNARAGKPARIVARMNALGDEATIRALYAASQAGVKIDLIVRGACALRPGVKGLSDNIRVVSVIGRFLEHSRVFWFKSGGADKVYLSSADWLGRNLFRRIEIAWPVLDPKLKRRVITEGLKVYLEDRAESWRLTATGEYRPPSSREGAFSAQNALLESLLAPGD